MVQFFPLRFELIELLPVVRDRCRRPIRSPARRTLDAIDIVICDRLFGCAPLPKIASKVTERVSVEEVRCMDYYQQKERTEEFHIRQEKQNGLNDAAEYYTDRAITLAGMAASEIEIRSMGPHDWVEVRRIYLEGIATGNATFETEAPSWEKWDSTHS